MESNNTASTVDVVVFDHSKCMFSTGIDDGLTAGQGELDWAGFWSTPCSHCEDRMRSALKDPIP